MRPWEGKNNTQTNILQAGCQTVRRAIYSLSEPPAPPAWAASQGQQFKRADAGRRAGGNSYNRWTEPM